MRPVPITGDTIRLGQLLKLAGVLDSGAGVKALLAGEPACVNGEPETRRGRQLHPGDVVRAGGEELRVVAEEGHGGGESGSPLSSRARRWSS